MSNSILNSDDYSLDKRKTISITNVSKSYSKKSNDIKSKLHKIEHLYNNFLKKYLKKIYMLVVIIVICILYTQNYDLFIEYYKMQF